MIPGKNLELPGLGLPGAFQGIFAPPRTLPAIPSSHGPWFVPLLLFHMHFFFPFFPSFSPSTSSFLFFFLLPSLFSLSSLPSLGLQCCINDFPHHWTKCCLEARKEGGSFQFTVSGCGPPQCSFGGGSWRHLATFICSQDEDGDSAAPC